MDKMNLIKLLVFCVFFLIAPAQAKTLKEGLSLLNEEKYKAANEVFRALSDKGNAKAFYWLAYTQFKTLGTVEAGSSLLKAAEGGNPWAMATLAGTYMPKVDRSFCGYLGWPCEEQWVDKAIEGWKKLAEEGNGKAMYALLYHDPSWWQYIPIYREYRYGELAEKIYKSKGYTFFFDSHFWSWVNEDIRLEYLEKMAKDGNMVAVYEAAFMYKERGDIKKAIDWIDYGVRNNDFNSLLFKSIMFIPFMREAGVGEKEDTSEKKAFFYCMIAHSMNNKHDCKLTRYFDEFYDEENDELKYFDKYTGEYVSKEDIESVKAQARQKAKGHKANLYLDETTVEFFKGFRKNL
ncbi:hypothetical protein BZG76_11465 [Salinivibrio sp. AR647]|uniref:hypothetical protein n=1 Tax=Salinivibrio sp. AR647 TaxID=1909438 RepID=UPI0009871DCD|nr:hypothetical protein [Salinivibrio sp. AR647]OOE91520.1 hypothetical protein BZG76_11465 [Salinivibrio sp. AR647]